MSLRKLALALLAAVTVVGLSGCHFGLGHHHGHNGYHHGYHTGAHSHYDYNGPAAHCAYCYH
jgi:hypothetical protein